MKLTSVTIKTTAAGNIAATTSSDTTTTFTTFITVAAIGLGKCCRVSVLKQTKRAERKLPYYMPR